MVREESRKRKAHFVVEIRSNARRRVLRKSLTMGIDLCAKGRSFSFNNGCWAGILETAMEHGWEPSGTGPCRGCRRKDRDGNGHYFANDGQLFYARDAQNLALALERFLSAPNRTKPRKTRRTYADDFLPYFLSAAGRQEIKEFIAFCRKGSFRIF